MQFGFQESYLKKDQALTERRANSTRVRTGLKMRRMIQLKEKTEKEEKRAAPAGHTLKVVTSVASAKVHRTCRSGEREERSEERKGIVKKGRDRKGEGKKKGKKGQLRCGMTLIRFERQYVPAMSRWAQRMRPSWFSASLPSTMSPSTKRFRKMAAVQAPPRRPPVLHRSILQVEGERDGQCAVKKRKEEGKGKTEGREAITPSGLEGTTDG
jgi:hypothetical protein